LGGGRVIFGYIWEINSYSQSINQIYGKNKFLKFDIALKLEFEVKNW